MKEFTVRTSGVTQFVDIQAQVNAALKEIGIRKGICTVFCPHTTAGITINENADPDVVRDIQMELEKMIPFHDPDYRHIEGNSAAHVKSSLIGSSVLIPVEDGKLCLGTWQGIYFCEFDGPRHRKVWVQAVG